MNIDYKSSIMPIIERRGSISLLSNAAKTLKLLQQSVKIGFQILVELFRRLPVHPRSCFLVQHPV
jgi:hypothetical protein